MNESKVIGYFTEGGVVWNAKVILAAAVTDGVSCSGYSRKTIYFLSTVGGTLTIQVLEPDGTWRNYDPETISANVMAFYIMTGDAERLRLSFSAVATVTAWYTFKER